MQPLMGSAGLEGHHPTTTERLSFWLRMFQMALAVRLNADARVRAYVVEAENFESIHNHSAYALIERNKDAAPR